MIGVLIFYIHVVAIVWIYTRAWQDGGMTEGFLGAAFFGVIFSVGWTFASFILKLILPPEGIAVWCDRNTLSLVFLTFLELILYRLYFWNYFTGAKKLTSK
jgi:hypothetical protein